MIRRAVLPAACLLGLCFAWSNGAAWHRLSKYSQPLAEGNIARPPAKFYFKEGIYNIVSSGNSEEFERFSFHLYVFKEKASRRVRGEVQYPSGRKFWSEKDRQYFDEYSKVSFTPSLMSRTQLRFSTKVVDGISFRFDGIAFGLAESEFSDTAVVKGTLTKYNHGRKVTSGVFGFSFRPFVFEG